MSILYVLIAALAAFINGFLWHGPLFGKTWMRLANVTPTGNEKMSDMYGQMLWNYLSLVVTAFIMQGIFVYVFTSPLMGGINAWEGAIVAVWLWLGFIVTSSSVEVIWMGRSWKLWLFECASSLTSFILMGGILGFK